MAVTSKVKLSDVAAAARVSVPAASMALANHPRISPQTRRRVWALSKRMGYRQPGTRVKRPTPAIAVRRLGCIGLGDSFDRPNNAYCFARFTANASRMNIQLDAACIEDISDDQKVADALLRLAEPLDGLVLLGTVRSGAVTSIAERHIPCVALGDQPVEQERLPLDIVTFDHVASLRKATEHLLNRGHRRIAFLCDTLMPGGANLHWLDGYHLAHLDAGAPIDPELVAVTNVFDGGTGPSIQRLTALASPPSAWVVVNNHQAAELMITLNRLGRRDEVCAHYLDTSPQVAGLASIKFPMARFVDAAMSRLLYLCKNPGEPASRIVVPFEFFAIDPAPSTRPPEPGGTTP